MNFRNVAVLFFSVGAGPAWYSVQLLTALSRAKPCKDTLVLGGDIADREIWRKESGIHAFKVSY